MRLVQFGSVLLPEEDGDDKFNFPARSSLYTLAGGSYDQDGGTLYPQSRNITRSFVVMADDDYTIQDRIDELMSEFSEGRKVLKAITRDEEYRQTFAKVLDVDMNYKPGDIGQQPLKVVFEVDYPYWLKSTDEPTYLNQGYSLDGTWTFDPGNYEDEDMTSSPHNFNITVSEGVRIPRGYLVVTPGSSASIEDFTISNAANSMSFTYEGEIVDGEQLVVQFLTKTVELDDVADYANFSIPADQPEWMILEVGTNAITITADSISNTVNFLWQWSHHYK